MIDNIFNFINFSLVALIFFTLFIKYALPALRQEISQRDKDENLLQQHYHHLISEERELLKHAQNAHQLHKKLQDKVAQWQEVVSIQNADFSVQRAQLYQMIQEKRVLQQERKAYMAALHHAACESIQSAEKELQRIARHDQQLQQEYCKRAVEQLLGGGQ